MAKVYAVKMPNGAVRSQQSVEIQLRGAGEDDIALLMRKDGENSVEYLPMSCSGNNLYVNYRFETPGL